MAFRGRQIANHLNLGKSRDAEIGFDQQTSGTVGGGTRLARKLVAERRGGHASRPYHAGAGDAFHPRASVVLHLGIEPIRVDAGYACMQAHLHTELLKLLPGALAQGLGHRLQDARSAFEQQDARARRVDAAKLAG